MKVDLFVHYSAIIDEKEDLLMCRFEWYELLDNKHPRNKSVREYFNLCLERGVFIKDKENFRLSKHYSDKIREIYEIVGIDNKFLDDMKHYYPHILEW